MKLITTDLSNSKALNIMVYFLFLNFRCKPGFFNLDLENEFGCTPCFCFGHSSQCTSAPKYQAHELSAHFIRDAEKWNAEDSNHKPATLQFNANTQNIGKFNSGNLNDTNQNYPSLVSNFIFEK